MRLDCFCEELHPSTPPPPGKPGSSSPYIHSPARSTLGLGPVLPAVKKPGLTAGGPSGNKEQREPGGRPIFWASPEYRFLSMVDEVAKWWIQIPDAGRASVVPFDRIETRARLWSTTSIPLPTQKNNGSIFLSSRSFGYPPGSRPCSPPPLRHPIHDFLFYASRWRYSPALSENSNASRWRYPNLLALRASE